VTSGGVAYYRQTEGQTPQPGYVLCLSPLQVQMQKNHRCNLESMPVGLCEVWQLLGVVLHSSDEQAELSQDLRHDEITTYPSALLANK